MRTLKSTMKPLIGHTMRALRRLVSRIPIYGALILARPTSRKVAAKELSIASVFSLLPIWLYPLLLFFADQPFWETVKSGLIRGELYLYSAALLGPLIYSVSKPYGTAFGDSSNTQDSERTFPLKLSLQFPYEALFSVIAALVCAIAAAVFALMRARTEGFFAAELNETAAFWGSVFLYGFTLSCMFCVLVYRLDLENVPSRFSHDVEELKKEWENY